MNIPRHPQTPAPLQFGSRYKSRDDLLKQKKEVQQSGVVSVGTAILGLASLPSGAGAAFPIFSGLGCALSAVVDDARINHEIREAKANEPAPEPPEKIIENALQALEADRQKQREAKTQILEAYAAETAKLTALQEQIQPETGRPRSLAEELEVHRQKVALDIQEKTVAQMKIHAEAATAIDNQFETKMLEIKKRYLGMMAQLQQIEQNKKMLEMQKNLEQLKGSTLQSPELKSIQEQLDEDLHKSNGLVENFLVEASALSKLQTQDQTDFIQKLKNSQ